MTPANQGDKNLLDQRLMAHNDTAELVPQFFKGATDRDRSPPDLIQAFHVHSGFSPVIPSERK